MKKIEFQVIIFVAFSGPSSPPKIRESAIHLDMIGALQVEQNRESNFWKFHLHVNLRGLGIRDKAMYVPNKMFP